MDKRGETFGVKFRKGQGKSVDGLKSSIDAVFSWFFGRENRSTYYLPIGSKASEQGNNYYVCRLVLFGHLLKCQ